ncbi:hypothetical protein BGY98DRAFT_934082 [Russula aff. rugulosa BPL654]|nr:hypothetical protein BGY98DRAFT_934082 [Russula aff. rugulosa BPL654]
MIFTSLALLSGMVLSASAAPWYSPPAPVTHCVNVSNDTAGLIYDPPYICRPGDIISFTFHPKNHTVTQSSFDAPCTPLYGGVDTGLQTLSGFIANRMQTPGQPLWQGHGIRSESWTRWKLELVRCFQGKCVGSGPTVGGGGEVLDDRDYYELYGHFLSLDFTSEFG